MSMLRIFLILCLLLSLQTKARGESLNWSILPKGVLTEEQVESLRVTYPSISDYGELQRLMVEISRIRPFHKLESKLVDHQIVFETLPAKFIGDIDVDSTSYDIQSKIERIAQKFVGLVDSRQSIKNLKNEVRNNLERNGFYLSEIKITRSVDSKFSYLTINIKEDYPCRFSKVKFGFSLPDAGIFDIKPGDICDKNRLSEALDELETNLVEDGYNQAKVLQPQLKFDRSTNTAELLIPGEIGKKITYTIDSPVKEILSDELSDIDALTTDPEAMMAEIKRNYRVSGYDDVEVFFVSEQNIDALTINYAFKVKPGPRYIINQISYQGVREFEIKHLNETLGFDGLFASPLNYEALQVGIEAIKGLYLGKGYWEVEVPYPRVTKNSVTGEVKLVFVIREGKQRVFSNLSIIGNEAISKEDIEELIDLEESSSISFDRVSKIEEDLENFYKDHGYLYVKIAVDLDQQNDFRVVKTNIKVTVDEGPRVKFGTVSVTGLVHTNEEVVLRELRFEKGDWYNPELVEESRLALVKLGIFSSVTVAISDASILAERTSTIPFTVSVREGRPGTVAFGPGWSLEDGGRYIIESSYNNISGTGRKIYFKSKISAEKRQEQISNKSLLGRFASVGYIEPFLFDLPVNGVLSLSHKAQANLRVWQLTNGGEAAINHNLLQRLYDSRISWFYGRRVTRLETNDIERNPLIFVGGNTVGEIGIRADLDARDNISWTTEGYRLNSELTWAKFNFGGDVGYFLWKAKASTFYELFESWTLAVSYSASSYNQIKREGPAANVLPTSERLHAGGAESNRGFQSRELGPYFEYWDYENGQVANKLVAGGTNRSVFKLEVRHQFPSKDYGIAAFIDSSNVFFSKQQERIFNEGFANQYNSLEPPPEGEPSPTKSTLSENIPYRFEDLLTHPDYLLTHHYVSYGLAVSLFTPLGPIDFSYGIPWKRCPPTLGKCLFERGATGKNKIQSGVFHINIGSNF